MFAVLRGLFIFVVAKYVFLTYTMRVVEAKIFGTILPKLKLIDQYDFQFTLSESKIVLPYNENHTISKKTFNGFNFIDRKIPLRTLSSVA